MIRYQLLPNDNFLLVRLEGLVTPEAWQAVLSGLEAPVRSGGQHVLVLNLEGLLGWLGEPERRAVGRLMAHHFAGMKKVALVIESRKITGVVEEEAQRQGLDLRLFASQEEAVAWVLA